jgi:hypothetical protein
VQIHQHVAKPAALAPLPLLRGSHVLYRHKAAGDEYFT